MPRQPRTPAASSTVRPATQVPPARTITKVVFHTTRGTRVRRASTPGSLVAASGVASTAPRWRQAPTMSTTPMATTTCAWSVGDPAHHRAPPPMTATGDDGHGERRTGAQGGSDEHREHDREHRGRPAAHGQHDRGGTDDGRCGVAGPRREDPAGAACRTDGDGVSGHVAAQHEPGEPATDEHADARVAQLVHEGDRQAQHAPERVERHGHEGRDEHGDHRTAGQRDAVLGQHPSPHLADRVHGARP